MLIKYKRKCESERIWAGKKEIGLFEKKPGEIRRNAF